MQRPKTAARKRNEEDEFADEELGEDLLPEWYAGLVILLYKLNVNIEYMQKYNLSLHLSALSNNLYTVFVYYVLVSIT